MADILIKGLALPKKGDTYGLHLSIFPDGDVYVEYDEEPTATAVALPDHGRLISDKDVKSLLRSGLSLDSDADIDHVCGMIDGLPTIVEASNE